MRNIPMDALLDKLKWDSNGLIPVIIQDVANGQVLVMAYTNREATYLKRFTFGGTFTTLVPKPIFPNSNVE